MKFRGSTENAVRIQVYVVCHVHLLLVFGGNRPKDMQLDLSTNEVLQILSISLTDKTPLRDHFDRTTPQKDKDSFRLNEPKLLDS